MERAKPWLWIRVHTTTATLGEQHQWCCFWKLGKWSMWGLVMVPWLWTGNRKITPIEIHSLVFLFRVLKRLYMLRLHWSHGRNSYGLLRLHWSHGRNSYGLLRLHWSHGRNSYGLLRLHWSHGRNSYGLLRLHWSHGRNSYGLQGNL